MASRKPSISRASKKVTRKPAARKVGVTVIPDALMARIDKLEVLAQQTAEKLQEVRDATPAAPALVLDGLVAEQLKAHISSLRGIEEAVVKIAERLLEAPPAKERKPRKLETQIVEPTAEPAPTPKEKKPDRATCTHPLEQLEYVPGNPKLSRCKACGATIDTPLPAGEKLERQDPTEPKEEKAPSFEELREHAVKFAQKHSKGKMLEVLSPFAGVPAAEVKLSLIPEPQRAAAIRALEAA